MIRLHIIFATLVAIYCVYQPVFATPLPISVQLWSVKDELKQDFDGTLQALADMGFDGVEFASDVGPYAENPHELKRLLDSLDLKASSAHIGFNMLSEHSFAKTLLFYKTIGVKTLYIPWDDRAWNSEHIEQFIDQLSLVHEQAQRFDMAIGFHNHDREFEQFKEATFWHYIATHTPKSLPLQLDIGWVHFAQQQPIAMIQAYPQRIQSTHIKVVAKDNNLSPIIGDNDIDWRTIISTLSEDGGTKWLILEQEQYPQGMTPLQSVGASKKALDALLSD